MPPLLFLASFSSILDDATMMDADAAFLDFRYAAAIVCRRRLLYAVISPPRCRCHIMPIRDAAVADDTLGCWRLMMPRYAAYRCRC